MDELAFLTLILLINYRIPHVLIEFHECYFWPKIKVNHTLWPKEQKCHPITRRHAVITWIEEPANEANRCIKRLGSENTKGNFLEAYWSRSLTRGWAHWSAKPTDQPTRAPLHRPSFLVGNFLEISLWQFKVPHAQKLTRIVGEPPL